MNTQPDPLDRLLNSAARAAREPAEELPVAVELRVLSRWRSADAAADLLDWLPLCRRALACAALLMLAAAVWSYQAYRQSNAPELAGINSAINLALNP